MRTLFTLLYGLLLTGAVSLYGQSDATIKIADVTANCETQIVVPVTIETDITLISYQFSIMWEDPVLDLVTVTNMAGGSFNFGLGSPPQPDKVGVSWSFPSGRDFTAGETLFTLTFDIVGGTTGPSPIVFSEVPTQTELLGPGVTPVNLIPDPGSITVSGNGSGPPTIPDCPTSPVTATADMGQSSAAVSGLGITPMDCDPTTTTYTLAGATTDNGTGTDASGNFNVGTTTVTYTVSDGTNTTNCTFDVVVSPSGGGGDLEIFTVPSTADCNDQTGYIDVFVNNFQDIGSLDFSFSWDPSVIQLDNSNPTDMEALPAAFVGPAPPQPGLFSFSWAEANHPGFPNNPTLLLRINFNIVGNPGDSTPFQFSNNPATEAFSNSTLSSVNVITTGTTFVIESDTDDPVITSCPSGVITETANPGESSAIVSGIGAAASDNCGTVNISYSATGATPGSGSGDLNNTAFNIGTTDVTYTFSDGTNQVTCDFQVIVESGNPDPIILSIENVGPISCQATQFSVNILAENLTDVGSLQFTLNLADENTFNYFSVSNIAFPGAYQGPTGTNVNNPASFTWVDVDGMSFPGGSGVLLTLTFDIIGNPGGTTELQFTNNPTTIEGVYTNLQPAQVIVNNGILMVEDDTEAPVVNCPVDATVVCGDDTTPANTGMATVTDNCSTGIVPTFSDDISGLSGCGTGTIVRTWTASDGVNNGNCTQNILISAIPVNAICATSTIVVTVDANNGAAITIDDVNNGSSGGCGSLGFMLNTSSFDCSNLGENTVTLTVTDDCDPNNSNFCTATVDVQLNNNIVLTCPPDAAINCGESLDPSATGMATAVDACGNTITPTFSDNPVVTSCSPGNVTRTWTATDEDGNSISCDQEIIIVDVPISAVCQDISVQLDNSGNVSIDAADIDNGSTGCGTLSLSASQTTFGCEHIGDNTVTLTVADDCGGTDNCTATVTVTAAAGSGQINITCPSDINVTCEPGSINPAETGVATAEDACGDPLIPTFSDNPTFPDGCSIGTFIRTWVASDGTNSTTCDQTITVNANPININCQDLTVPLGTDGTVTIAGNSVGSGTTGGCGGLTFEVSPSVFTCGDIGDNMVLLTVSDECGNMETCTATITVTSNGGGGSASITCPPDVQINCGDSTAPNATGMATATEDCEGNTPVVTFDDDDSMLDPCGIGQITRTWSATTVNGTVTCDQIITISGIPIIAVCQDITVMLDNGVAMITANDVNNGSNGGCGNLNFSIDEDTFTSTGMFDVVLTVTDPCAQADNCTAVVTVEEGNPPVIVCPDPVTINTEANSCSATVNNINVTIQSPDMSEIASVTYTLSGATTGNGTGDASGTTFNQGTTTVIYTVTDNNGQSAECSFTVIVMDDQAPTINCPGDRVIQTSEPSVQVSGLIPAILDNCPETGFDDLTYLLEGATTGSGDGHVDGFSFNQGVTTVTYTVTDEDGNSADCSFTITVGSIDVVCPADTIVSNDTLLCSAVVNDIYPDSIDMDAVASVTFEISGATDSISATTGFNDASGITFNLGVSTVIYTITDNFDATFTCEFDVTVNDTENPVISDCPENISLNIMEGSCDTTVTWTAPTAMDNCALDTIIGSHEPGDIFPAGTTTVMYIATDESGNRDICSFDITISEPVPPVIECLEDITISAELDSCNAVVNWTPPTATDDCGAVTVSGSHIPGDTFPVGETQVTYIATDLSGNMDTCQFMVIVQDEQMPVITGCPDDIMLTATGCDTTATWTPPVAMDNCMDNLAFSSTHNPGDNFIIGTTTVTYTATDGGGNTVICSFTVTVDGNDPIDVVSCPLQVTVDNDPGECQAAVSFIEPEFASDCSTLDINSSDTSGDIFPVGTTEVVYVALDTFGNSDTCRFNIIVSDNEAPTFTDCPEDGVIGVDAGLCEAAYSWTVPTAGDNCGIESVVTSNEPGDIFQLGINQVSYAATDVNGNVSFCRFFITVEDNQAPVYDCPQDVEVSVDGTIISDPDDFIDAILSDECNAVNLFFNEPPAVDNCTPVSNNQTGGPGSSTLFEPGVYNMEFTAIDTFDNGALCTFEILVSPVDSVNVTVDNATPCEGESVKFSIDGLEDGTYDYVWTGPNGTMYGGSVLVIDPVTSEESGTWEVVVTDVNGCEAIGVFEITVFPTPQVEASSNQTLFCDNANQSLELTATDLNNVGIIEWIWNTPRGILNEQNPTISDITQADSGDYIVTALTENGCAGSDTISISVMGIGGPSPVLIAVPNTLCRGETVNLTATAYAGENIEYHWGASPMEGSGLTQINGNVNLVTPTVAGDYIYSYWVTDNGCSTDTVEVEVHVEQAVEVEVEVTGDTLCLDGSTSVTLTAITDPVASNTTSISCTWMYPDDSTANPGDELVLNNATAEDSGLYMVECTTLAGCVSTKSRMITITEQPPVPTVSASEEDGLICLGSAFTLTGTEYPAPVNYIWTASPVEGSGLNPLPSNILEVSPTLAGVYTYTLNIEVDGCLTDGTSISIEVSELPEVDLSTMPSNLDCISSESTLVLTESSGTASSWTWTTPSGEVLNGNDIVLTDLSEADAGTYNVVIENAAGCIDEDAISIGITFIPASPILTGTTEACENDDAALCIENYDENLQYIWTAPNGSTQSTMEQCLNVLNVNNANQGDYVAVAVQDGCSSAVSAAHSLAVLDAPILADDEFIVDWNPTTPLSANTLDVTTNDDFNKDADFVITLISKTFKGELINNGDGTFSYTPNQGELGFDNFVYEICYADCLENCDMVTVSIEIKVGDDECIPTTVVTPNGDSKNDRFVITCAATGNFPNNELFIYNRWGDLMYEASPYDNTWDATYNGETIPDGTYYFIFKRDANDSNPIKSFITIYKQAEAKAEAKVGAEEKVEAKVKVEEKEEDYTIFLLSLRLSLNLSLNLRLSLSLSLLLQKTLIMLRYLSTIILCSFMALCYGQQESHFTYFMLNQQYINPAYVGVRDVPSFTGIYRNQWIGFDGSPQSVLVSFDSPIFKNVGFGLIASNHRAGITNSWYTSMSYSYNLQVTEDVAVRLGLQGTMKYFFIDFSDNSVFVLDGDDPSIAGGDAVTRYTGNVGAGAYLSVKNDMFYMGMSVPHMMRTTTGVNPDVINTAFDQPHLYGIIGGSFPTSSNGKLEFRPAVLVKYTNGAPIDFDINASLMFNRELMAGLSYRYGGNGQGESIDLLIFYQLAAQVGLGVAYDFTLSGLRPYNSGTFEILLRYDVKSEKQTLENPRFFQVK